MKIDLDAEFGILDVFALQLAFDVDGELDGGETARPE
jgi:hypothetical protein